MSDIKSLTIRAKKMAGALGRIPTEGELIQSLWEKGTEIPIRTAHEIIVAVKQYWKEKGREQKPKAVKPNNVIAEKTKVATTEQAGPTTRTEQTEPSEKREYAAAGPVKHTTSYGY